MWFMEGSEEELDLYAVFVTSFSSSMKSIAYLLSQLNTLDVVLVCVRFPYKCAAKISTIKFQC